MYELIAQYPLLAALFALVSLGDASADGQTQAGTTNFQAALVLYSVELIKDKWQLRGWYTGPIIFNFE